MKITEAWIDDPTVDGLLQPPRLQVVVTEQPNCHIEAETFAGGWSVSKWGPFVKYTCHDSDVTAGDFNMRFRDRFPVVIDIDLWIGEEQAIDNVFSLPLTRARQLVRKYQPEWRLLVNERAAEKGRLLWTPVRTNPTCHFVMSNSGPNSVRICGARPARLVHVEGVDVPMCSDHLHKHNTTQAAKRLNPASK